LALCFFAFAGGAPVLALLGSGQFLASGVEELDGFVTGFDGLVRSVYCPMSVRYRRTRSSSSRSTRSLATGGSYLLIVVIRRPMC